MRVLITGASGFIGRALASSFIRKGVDVFGIGTEPEAGMTGSGKFSDYRTMRLPDAEFGSLLSLWAPSLIYHCAGSADPARSLIDPRRDFEGSLPVVFNLLEALRESKTLAHFVLLSSAAVYGQPDELPVREDSPLAPLSPYGFHKRLSEMMCAQYSELYGIQTSCARIFSAYGPGLKRQVVWDAIKKFSGGGQLEFMGTGEESRDFIFIDDLVEALEMIGVSSVRGHRVWNVASGVETPIAELVRTIASAMGRKSADWKFTSAHSEGVPRNWRADITSLADLGFSPRNEITEGVAKTIAWAAGELAAPLNETGAGNE